MFNSVVAFAPGDTPDMLKRAPDSAAMLPFWEKVEDIVTGADAVIGRAEVYLPKFPNELVPDYEFRLKLAKFTNIYRDILEGLASKPFEEEVSLVKGDDTIPEQIEAFIEDVDGSGNNLTVFAAATFFSGVNNAIDWIFVDYVQSTNDDGRLRTRAEELALGIRPFWSHVTARNVLEVRSAIINGQEELTYVRIYEPGIPNRVRVMERVGSAVSWQLWEEQTAQNTTVRKFEMVDQGPITIGVIPMVPFITGRRDGRRYFYYPPMRDAADLQINMYRAESGLEFAKTLTAFPMLAGNGVKPEIGPDGKPVPVGVGPARVVYAPPSAANGSSGSWTFIEPSAQSLVFLQSDIAATGQQLRELGRQPLTAQSGQLTVNKTQVAASKARSAVSAWALALKDTLENALILTGMWMDIKQSDYDPEVNVYNEFDNFTDNGADLEALTTARAAGDLSQETYWFELKRRRVLSPEFDRDEELKRILAETPGDGSDDERGLTGEPPLQVQEPIPNPVV